jgi:hypothetical protein
MHFVHRLLCTQLVVQLRKLDVADGFRGGGLPPDLLLGLSLAHQLELQTALHRLRREDVLFVLDLHLGGLRGRNPHILAMTQQPLLC